MLGECPEAKAVGVTTGSGAHALGVNAAGEARAAAAVKVAHDWVEADAAIAVRDFLNGAYFADVVARVRAMRP